MTPTSPVNESIIGHLRARASASLSDTELLSRFIDVRDEAAFAAVVDRHGSFVYRLCRRRLNNPIDADDAFQAVFLALIRNAGSIRKRCSLGAWLYGAVHRVCLEVRRGQARSQRDSRTDRQKQSRDPLAELSARELMRAIEQEMSFLPERLRLPIELCLVEGLSLEEAAARLGWSGWRVKGRLQRGRERLRRRLRARGVTLGVGLAAVVLDSATAAVPSSLTGQTLELVRGRSVTANVARLAAIAPTSIPLVGRASIAVAVCALFAVTAFVVSSDGPAEKSPAASPTQNPVAIVDTNHVDAYGDPLPAGAIARLGTLRFQSGMWPKSIAPSPDGSKFATIGHNNQIHLLTIWNAKSGQPIRQIELHVADVDWLHWLPDGRGFALVQVNEYDYVAWEFTSDNATTPTSEAGSRPVIGNGTFRVAAISAEGKLVASGERFGAPGNEGRLEVRELVPNKRVRTMKRLWQFDSPNVFLGMQFTRDGKRLVAISQQQEPWHTTPNPNPNLPGPATGPLAPSKFADFAEVSVRDAQTGVESVRFITALGKIALSPDGDTLFVRAKKGQVVGYRLGTGKECLRIQCFENNRSEISTASNLAVSADGKTLVATRFDATNLKDSVAAFDLNTGKPRWRIDDGSIRAVLALATMPDNEHFVLGSADGAILLCETATGKCQPPLVAHRGGFRAILPSRDGMRVITCGMVDSSIRQWDVESGKELDRLIKDDNRPNLAIDFSPTGNVAPGLARNTGKPALGILDLKSGELSPRFPCEAGSVSASLSPRSHAIVWLQDSSVVLTEEHKIAIRLGLDGKEIRRYVPGPGRLIFGMAAAPDGKWIVLCGQGQYVGLNPLGWAQVFDANTGKTGVLWETATPLRNACFTPDGERVIITADIHQPSRALDQPSSILSPSQALATFDMASGKGYALYEAPAEYREGRWLGPIAIGPGGYQVAVAEVDNSITVYETASGKIRHRFFGHRNEVTALGFAPGGQRLISASRDGTGLVWNVSPTPFLKSKPETRGNQSKNWSDLTSSDGATAFRAMGELFADPNVTVDWIKSHLKCVALPTDPETEALLAELGDDSFRKRQAASNRLEKFGALAIPYVRKSIKSVHSAEVRQRLTDFINLTDKPGILTGDRLRERRAVELLEAIATPEARAVLRRWADGAAPLCKDCADALKRIGSN
jgi:RNA polymerase sigma factor (sigma-70 family)